MQRVFVADAGDAGRRLDLVIRRHVAGVAAATRTRVQRWIEDGRVAVNGAAVRRAASRTRTGDVVRLTLPVAPRAAAAPEDIALDVLYEDDGLLAVNKPAGLVVHPTYRHARGTLLNGLLWRACCWSPSQRPSIVGRLDKLTSGLVVVAKSPAVHALLQRTFADRSTEKEYLAVVYGRVAPGPGQIELRLRHCEADRRLMIVSAEVGAPSVTLFERLASVDAPRAGLAWLKCRLVTGRRHQIRAHLAACGWPVVGDAAYGEPRWQQVEDLVLASALRAFGRQALHAWRASFVHPVTRARIRLEAPVPDDFRQLLAVSGLSPR